MKNIILILGLFSYIESFAQGDLILNAADIVVNNGATVYVTGNVQFDANTTLHNDGVVRLEKDWINNSLSPAIDSLTTGLIILNGANQNITGGDITRFYRLEIQNANTVKSAQIDVTILNNLNLTNSVLETNQFLVHLQNPIVTSLQFNGGYISGSSLQGYFLRSTNSTNNYAFPVGSNTLTNNYRAVEITPTTTDSSVFGVRLGSLSPSSETGISAAGSTAPFDVNLKATNLGALNQNYFHTINRFFGVAAANTAIYFFNTDAQNIITTVGKWSSPSNQWEDDNFTVATLSTPNSAYNLPNKIATSNQPITYVDDVYALSEIELVIPTGITPNGDGFNDVFVIKNLEQFPNNEIEIYNRWGEKVFAAKPYLNNWNGINTSGGMKLQGENLQEDTYFYILKLDETMEPIKNYLELIRN